jgi:mono/diheme cytochrome c family protein
VARKADMKLRLKRPICPISLDILGPTDRAADQFKARVIKNFRQLSAASAIGLGLIPLVGNWVVFAGEPLTKSELQEQLERGHAIALANCSVCHAVGLTDKSPTRINSNTAFRQLSGRFPIPMLQEAARTGNISGHDEMPGFQFTMDDIKALLSYIDSMAPADARYIARPEQR